MAKDIPKATIAVLLVLTILVSVIGTWTVLESISIKETSHLQKTVEVGDNDGNIKLSLEEQQVSVEDGANIRFEIK